MLNRSKYVRALVLAACGGFISAFPADVRAEINGFPIPGWQLNQLDAASAPPVNPPQSITITTSTINQRRSAFYTTKQDISQFHASFTYQFTGSSSTIMGAAFVIQNVNLGAGAVGNGSHFAYTDPFAVFGGRSLAVALQSSYLSAGSSSTGVYTGGAVDAASSISTSPVNFFSGHPIDFSVDYNGALLRMTAQDTVTGLIYEAPTTAQNLPSIMGGSLAYIGFTASTNGNSGTTQTFSNFVFTSVPSPGAAGLLCLAGIATNRRRR